MRKTKKNKTIANHNNIDESLHKYKVEQKKPDIKKSQNNHNANTRNYGSLEKWHILDLEKEKQEKPEYLVVLESTKVLKNQDNDGEGYWKDITEANCMSSQWPKLEVFKQQNK